MNLNGCYRHVLDEAERNGERLTAEQVRVRALALNGAAQEFKDKAEEKAAAHERRVITSMMKERSDVEVDEDTDAMQLFSLLPFAPTRAIAIPAEENGEFVYVPFGVSTVGDREQSLGLKRENIARARERLRQDVLNHVFLGKTSGPETTAAEALEAAAHQVAA